MNKEVVMKMKKIITLSMIVVSMLLLASCSRAQEIEVTIANETFTQNEIQVDVIVSENFETIAQVEEIAYQIASQIYEKHFETIGTSSYSMSINLYDSESSLSNEDITYGSLIFDINKKLESPGLSLYRNLLTIE